MVIEMKNENKAIRFLKKHWKKGLVILGVATVSGVCGYAIFKSFSKPVIDGLVSVSDDIRVFDIDWPGIEEALDEGAFLDKVDEHIFTAVAPALEKAVLDKSVEKKVIETAYDLGDNLNKFVTITVENVYGD